MDDSGVRIFLEAGGSSRRRPHQAAVFRAGSFDFSLPAFADSSVSHDCLVSPQLVVGAAAAGVGVGSGGGGGGDNTGSASGGGADVSAFRLHVFAMSTVTHEAGNSARFEVINGTGATVFFSEAARSDGLPPQAI